jgi:hypothetical protein
MMEFRDISSANLVFVSVLDRSRTVHEVTDTWGLDPENFSSEKLDRELERLVQNKIMKKEERGLKAHLGSQPFRTELENYIQHMHSGDESQKILDDLSSHYSLLRSTGFRIKVFDIENIKNFYNENPSEAKENPLDLIYQVLKVLEGMKEPENQISQEAAEFR